MRKNNTVEISPSAPISCSACNRPGSDTRERARLFERSGSQLLERWDGEARCEGLPVAQQPFQG